MKETVRDKVGKAANNLKREVGESVGEVTEAVKVGTNRKTFVFLMSNLRCLNTLHCLMSMNIRKILTLSHHMLIYKITLIFDMIYSVRFPSRLASQGPLA